MALSLMSRCGHNYLTSGGGGVMQSLRFNKYTASGSSGGSLG